MPSDMETTFDPDGTRRTTVTGPALAPLAPVQSSGGGDDLTSFIKAFTDRKLKAYDEDRAFELAMRNRAISQMAGQPYGGPRYDGPGAAGVSPRGAAGPVGVQAPQANIESYEDRQMRQLALREARQQAAHRDRLRQMDLNPPKKLVTYPGLGTYYAEDVTALPLSMRPGQYQMERAPTSRASLTDSGPASPAGGGAGGGYSFEERFIQQFGRRPTAEETRRYAPGGR